MNFDSQLILGNGEVGGGLYYALQKAYKLDVYDPKEELVELKDQYDILHICFPYTKNFIKTTKEYIKTFNPKLVIIHSTVPVGTTLECGDMCVHSPIRGKHPSLGESIETFVKFIGGKNVNLVETAIKLFIAAEITCYRCADSNTSEFLKIMSTTYYGWNIVFQKEMKKLCEKYNVSYLDAYNVSNQTYNEGYDELLEDNIYTRPVLEHMPGEIGGHCIIPNCKLLDCDITKFILDKNEDYKNDN